MSANPARRTYETGSAYASPWTGRERVAMLLWHLAWTLLCGWTPKPLNPWRLLVARAFGARLTGVPFIHSRARIAVPWRLTMGDRACLGDGAQAYTLGEVTVEARATVAQEAFLCTGTHDFAKETLPLVTAPIRIGAGAFVGARAFVLPGVTIGAGAVIGACAVVTKDVPAGATAAGNPARLLKT
ncbi:putative colanic acid biosynthesis acetyltransferase WcaF [Verrucomicrobium sp. GAS474]|uniref:DapH/DapD/GlmU-related protein n=1 Tax=Verrucomicrobium sp. GAS474 TaxID=1882831 RepID=UPI00087CE5B6|nr:DapH/DapD/GlmU-related protein [Verrucomicrobium sp. GAS474]SDT86082.1 putative colanic acid biosynthesis acetyltransferase WcaF [Verrucomicrobium sp. GAS474]